MSTPLAPPNSSQGFPPNSSQGFPPQPSNSFPTDKPQFTGRQQTSNLYLIAFLAILFLLLIVSAGIVARSFILRRRYQRRLEDAMAHGQLLAPRAQGSKIKRFGAMPKVFNTWLAEGGDKWNQMMPVSAQPVFVKRKVKIVKQNTPDQITNVSDTITPPTRMSNLLSRFRHPLSLHNTLESDDTNEKRTSIPSTPNYKVRVEMLQLAVLIAMPSPRKSQKDSILENLDLDPDDDEKESDELPNIVFGVTRVNYRQSSNLTLLPLQPKLT